MTSSATSIRLVVFDLDGTLLRGATVCEMLANALGYRERMCELEQLNKLDDIRTARREIISWYRGRTVAELSTMLDINYLAPGAIEGIRLLRRRGVKVAIASLTWSFAVDWFSLALGVEHSLGTDISRDFDIRDCWPRDKANWLAKLRRELHCSSAAVAAVGDSSFDIPMLEEAGLRIFVGPSGLVDLPPDTVLMPSADIRDVAAKILEHY